jgi:glycosyltransferase involved in cell wall biosynthesis
VVGGWIGEFLRNKKIHASLLSRVKAILTESNYLTNSLKKEYHFKNVITFPNFRIHSFTPQAKVDNHYFRIVFMSRINKMKGIDYAFKLAENFNNYHNQKRPVIIDFYGPIEIEDKSYFLNNIKKYPNITYKGILQPEQIYETIHKYDLMIFPTRYYTEGFPGTILDAYISGLPIVATNWKYADDFITNGDTGIIVPFENSEQEFIQAVNKLYENDELLLKMKKNAYKKSEDFSSDSAWNILLKNNLIFS